MIGNNLPPSLRNGWFPFTLQVVRQVIAYLFILIFSIQIVPIKEIGEILFNGLITEEEVHGYGQNSEDNAKLKKQNEPKLPVSFYYNRICFLTQSVQTAIHRSENLPLQFVPEIITPPPNILPLA